MNSLSSPPQSMKYMAPKHPFETFWEKKKPWWHFDYGMHMLFSLASIKLEGDGLSIS